MKFSWSIIAITTILTISSCGGKKVNSASDALSNKHNLLSFNDVNNESTLNLEALKSLPRKIDLKNQMTSVKQQGERGTCSFFAAIALVEAAIKLKMNIDVNLSEEYLNYEVKKYGYFDNSEGSFPNNNLYVAIDKKLGFLAEVDVPYQPTWFGVKEPCLNFVADNSEAPLECFSHSGPSEATLSRKISGSNFKGYYFKTNTTNEIIEELASSQVPMTMIVSINDRGWTTGETQYTEEMRQECLDNENLCGNHVIVITGYDMDKKVFFFKNSWGVEWGNQGYGTIPFEVVDRHVGRHFVEVEMIKEVESLKNISENKLAPVELNDFKINSKLTQENSIEVSLTGEVKNINGRTLVASSTLVEVDTKMFENPNDSNAKALILTDEEKSRLHLKSNYISKLSYNFLTENQKDFTFNNTNPIEIKINKEILGTSSFKQAINSKNLMIRTSLYEFTDDAGYKVIKRIYHPINYYN